MDQTQIDLGDGLIMPWTKRRNEVFLSLQDSNPIFFAEFRQLKLPKIRYTILIKKKLLVMEWACGASFYRWDGDNHLTFWYTIQF